MATKPKGVQRQDTTLARRTATTEAFVALVNQVPEVPEGDIADLLGPILAATDWEDLNAQSKLPSSKDLTGKNIRVESVGRHVSDKDSLTGYYLLCDAVDIASGEAFRMSAGGEQSVAVLSKLHVLGKLPAIVQFDAVPTRSGNDAINCTVLAVIPSRTIDA